MYYFHYHFIHWFKFNICKSICQSNHILFPKVIIKHFLWVSIMIESWWQTLATVNILTNFLHIFHGQFSECGKAINNLDWMQHSNPEKWPSYEKYHVVQLCKNIFALQIVNYLFSIEKEIIYIGFETFLSTNVRSKDISLFILVHSWREV